jgi:hypothetical protein
MRAMIAKATVIGIGDRHARVKTTETMAIATPK